VKLRANIDVLDASLLETLGKRMKVADRNRSGEKGSNVAVLQNTRWNEILGKMILDGEQKDFLRFVLRMFKAIHQESIVHQEK
jgi:chorismate mutase